MTTLLETEVPVNANGRPSTLAEWVDDEARSYRAQGTPEACWIAEELERLAQLVRWTGARTAEEHRERMEVWDAKIREDYYDRGFAEGISLRGGA